MTECEDGSGHVVSPAWAPDEEYADGMIEHKAKLVSGLTQLLVDTLQKRPEHINVIIDEVGLDNWGFAGKLSSERRKQSEKK
jgi:4-oxalocrotonate tautomerase